MAGSEAGSDALRDAVPVFVIGAPRSGSTMLGSMLGSHSEGLAIPESRFFSLMAPADPDEVAPLASVIDRFVEDEKFRLWGIDLDGLRPEGEGRYADAVRWLVERFAERKGRTGIRFWVDHDPSHSPSIAKLAAHFPNALFIHIVRDGRAVAISAMATPFGPKDSLDAAQFWIYYVALGMAAQRFLPAERFVELRYESLVRDPERTLAPVLARLACAFEPDMPLGRGYEVPSDLVEIGLHPNVGRPPDPSRIDDWRRKFVGRDLEIFEAHVEDLLPMLGYPRHHAQPEPMNAEEQKALRWEKRLKSVRARLGLAGMRRDRRPAS